MLKSKLSQGLKELVSIVVLLSFLLTSCSGKRGGWGDERDLNGGIDSNDNGRGGDERDLTKRGVIDDNDKGKEEELEEHLLEANYYYDGERVDSKKIACDGSVAPNYALFFPDSICELDADDKTLSCKNSANGQTSKIVDITIKNTGNDDTENSSLRSIKLNKEHKMLSLSFGYNTMQRFNVKDNEDERKRKRKRIFKDFVLSNCESIDILMTTKKEGKNLEEDKIQENLASIMKLLRNIRECDKLFFPASSEFFKCKRDKREFARDPGKGYENASAVTFELGGRILDCRFPDHKYYKSLTKPKIEETIRNSSNNNVTSLSEILTTMLEVAKKEDKDNRQRYRDLFKTTRDAKYKDHPLMKVIERKILDELTPKLVSPPYENDEALLKDIKAVTSKIEEDEKAGNSN